jgi:hypothetical protein
VLEARIVWLTGSSNKTRAARTAARAFLIRAAFYESLRAAVDEMHFPHSDWTRHPPVPHRFAA